MTSPPVEAKDKKKKVPSFVFDANEIDEIENSEDDYAADDSIWSGEYSYYDI